MQVEIMIGTLPMMKMSRKSEEDTRKIKVVGYTRPSKCQSAMIYDPNGLARTLCRCDYKVPLKIIEKYFTEFDDDRFVTTERERGGLCNHDSPTHYSII